MGRLALCTPVRAAPSFGSAMIAGAVSDSLEALIRLTLHDAGGAMREIVALVDTGYNGELTLPPADIALLRSGVASARTRTPGRRQHEHV